jgi:hypothetical protein
MLTDPTPAVGPATTSGARESLDAPENLPKQALRQVALRQPEGSSGGSDVR